MLTPQHQQLYELQKKAGLIKGKKIPENNRDLEARVALLDRRGNGMRQSHEDI